jgi:hypothetical protein
MIASDESATRAEREIGIYEQYALLLSSAETRPLKTLPPSLLKG